MRIDGLLERPGGSSLNPGTLVRTDADILQDARDELNWDPEVDHRDIDVNIEDGVVTLSGSVESYRMKLTTE